MKNLSEETIRMAADGDIQAFEALYRNCSEYVYNVSLRVVNSHEDAEEIVQEVFITVYRRLKNFRFESTFKTWIYRITTNTAIDYLRKASAVRKKEFEYNEQVSVSIQLNDVEDKINEEHPEEMMNNILSHLTPEQKVCMVLRNVEGLSYQEIADTLKININTVRTRLKRAREALFAIRKEVINNEV